MRNLLTCAAGLGLLGGALAGCGEEVKDDAPAECRVPPGTYTMSFARSGGDCDQLAMPEQDITVGADEKCETATNIETSTTDEGCAMQVTIKGTGTASGLEGTATVTVDCTDVGGGTCTANWNLHFELR